jgi:hypothetical protein
MVSIMLDEGQDTDQDLKALNMVYDELSKDARTIAKDLSESVAAYYILGFYILAFSFGMDLYIILSRGIVASDYIAIAIWLVFVNLIPIATGCFILYRYHKINNRYKTLFHLEKNIRLKEAKDQNSKKKPTGI